MANCDAWYERSYRRSVEATLNHYSRYSFGLCGLTRQRVIGWMSLAW